MKKSSIWLLVFLFFAIFMFSILILMMAGAVNLNWYGFGVDSARRIYIGETAKILIYEDGNKVGTIPVPTSRAYSFTLQEDDTILLSTSTLVYTFDLDGAELSNAPDPSGSVYNKLQWKRRFTAADGTIYRKTNRFGRGCIIRDDGEVVFWTPLGDYIAGIALILAVPGCLISGAGMGLTMRKKLGIPFPYPSKTSKK